MKYGLIGEKLGHSYSKPIHEALADYQYDLIPLAKDAVDAFMKAKDFDGINVTIPYKQTVIPYLDEIDPLAKEIGAVNCIVNHQGKLKGYNTDFYGFLYMIQKYKVAIKDKKCLILGTGGTSQTVHKVLSHLNASDIITVSRTASENNISYEECYKEHTDADIIVNTTPVGMYPKVDESPIDLQAFSKCYAVLDVIFNPTPTLLTLQAKELGKISANGLEMLVAQAKQAVEYFKDIQIPDQAIEEVYEKLITQIK